MRDPQRANQKKLYSAPRRFDLSTMLVVTSAYAVLFAGMKSLDFGNTAIVVVAGLITLVGAAQSVFDSWQNPRVVSVLAGVAYSAAITVLESGGSRFPGYLVWAIIANSIFGAFMGYFCGVLVGGVFLVSEFLRTTLLGRPPNTQTAADDATDESPWNDSTKS